MAIEDKEIENSIDLLADRVYQTAVNHGWWQGERNQVELIALIHSEASELLEGIRHGNPQSDHIPSFSAAEEELADIIIRCLDMARGYDLDVAGALMAKAKFNDNRPYKHGGKAF